MKTSHFQTMRDSAQSDKLAADKLAADKLAADKLAAEAAPPSDVQPQPHPDFPDRSNVGPSPQK